MNVKLLLLQSKAKAQRDKPQEKVLKSNVEQVSLFMIKQSKFNNVILTKEIQENDITEQRRALIEEKLQRAEMKRVSLLQEKIKKAQEEEAKVNQ